MLQIILFTALMCVGLLQENNPPVVKIVSPKETVVVEKNAFIRYQISVADKEDGDTRFAEIPTNEVLLEVNVSDGDSSAAQRDAIHAMMKSNCMNCHAFNSRLIGPSFYDIGNKYSDADTEELIKRIKEGSSGKWGSTVMPTHPELSVEETEKMVKWILEHGDSHDVSYYLGTEGTIRVENSALADKTRLTLIASYRDRNGAEGVDKVTVNCK